MSTKVGEGQLRLQTSALIENSPLIKVIACIPVVGNVFSWVVDLFLSQKIAKSANDSRDIPRVIELVELSKEYQKINVGRSLFSLILITSGIALGIISNPYAALILFWGCVFLTFYHIIQIKACNESIEELRTMQK